MKIHEKLLIVFFVILTLAFGISAANSYKYNPLLKEDFDITTDGNFSGGNISADYINGINTSNVLLRDGSTTLTSNWNTGGKSINLSTGNLTLNSKIIFDQGAEAYSIRWKGAADSTIWASNGLFSYSYNAVVPLFGINVNPSGVVQLYSTTARDLSFGANARTSDITLDDTTANVGIGQTYTATEKLSVNGSTTIYGNVNITGNINAVNITTDVHYFNTVTVDPACTGCMYRNGTGLIIVG